MKLLRVVAEMRFLRSEETECKTLYLASFIILSAIDVFQNGKEMVDSEMYLKNDFDWDSFDTQIKDGATITVFIPKPLDNVDDPVEVRVGLFDPSSHIGIADAGRDESD